MNEQERKLFEELRKDRTENADVLDKQSMTGVKKSVVEKYSDQAHFVYELLQNADDAGATYAKFTLYPDKIVFVHNGTRHFSITDYRTEADDAQNHCLGDINAITSVGNSSKRSDDDVGKTIGKFGIGFKSVFQYTSTPEIYDDNFFFRIERFFVPCEILSDYDGRRPGETVFVLPFNHEQMPQDEAYKEIRDTLKDLKYPVLFMPHLSKIYFECDNERIEYSKQIEDKLYFGDVTAEFVCQSNKGNDTEVVDRLWLFSRDALEGYSYSVGFFLTEDGHLKPVKEPAFCFFLTMESTELNFIIQAPFLLTDNRANIFANKAHNKKLVELLAQLAADSLIYLKKIGISKGVNLIDDKFFAILPYDESLYKVDEKKKISFEPFYLKIKDCLSKEDILPTSDGFCCADDACWASVSRLTELFTSSHISVLFNHPNLKWVFPSLGRDEYQKSNRKVAKYINSIVPLWLDESKIIKKIDGNFIDRQSFEWLSSLYKWLGETDSRIKQVKKKPIFLNQEKKAIAAYDANGKNILFIADENNAGNYDYVFQDFLEDPEIREFFEKVGIEKPQLKDLVNNIILPEIEEGKADLDSCFNIFFNRFRECSQEDMEDFIADIKGLKFLRGVNELGDASETAYYAASDLYYPTENLKRYFKYKPSTCFLDLQFYKSENDRKNWKLLKEFFEKLGCRTLPRRISRIISEKELASRKLSIKRGAAVSWEETCLDGCREILDCIINKKDKTASKTLWSVIIECINAGYGVHDLFTGHIRYKYWGREQFSNYESLETEMLRNKKWLINSKDNFISAKIAVVKSLERNYDVKSKSAQELLAFLEIPETREKKDNDSNLTEKQKEKINWAKRLERAGLKTEADLKEFLAWKKKKEQRENNTFNDVPPPQKSPKSKIAVERKKEDVNITLDSVLGEEKDIQIEIIDVPRNGEKHKGPGSSRVAKTVVGEIKTSIKRSLNGRNAEKIVLDELKTDASDLRDKFPFSFDGKTVSWVSGNSALNGDDSGDDSLGYDILIKDENDNDVFYIEVKSSEQTKCLFYMSAREYIFAQEHQENYRVIFVGGTNNEKVEISVLPENFLEDSGTYRVGCANYLVAKIAADENNL